VTVLFLHTTEGRAQQSDIIKIKDILNSFKRVNADTQRIRLLLEAAELYIRKSGELAADLDSASQLISEAHALNVIAKNYSLSLHEQYVRGMELLDRQDWESARKMLLPLADIYGSQKDIYKQATMILMYAAYIPSNEKYFSNKIALLEKAASLYRKINNDKREIEARFVIARAYFYTGKLDSTLSILHRMLNRPLGKDHFYYIDICILLSNTYQKKGNYTTALKHVLDGLKAWETKHNAEIEYFLFSSTAQIYFRLQNYEKTIEYINKAQQSALTRQPAYYYNNFHYTIISLVKLGNVNKALSLLDSITKKIPPVYPKAQNHIAFCYGYCYHALGNIKRAEHQYSLVKPEKEEYYVYNEFYNTIAQFYYTQKKYATAKDYLEKTLAIPQSKKAIADLTQSYFLLGKVDSCMGHYGSAYNHLRNYIILKDSMFSERKSKQIQELLVQYETEKKDQNIKLLTQQSELKQSQLDQATLSRNVTLGGVAALLIILGLMYNQYKVNQRSTYAINYKNVELQKMVEEKEWLLKEIHHRVKNNLQTIVSLLESQSSFLKDEALTAIQGSQNRVYAMSLLHQKLYQNNNVATISMANFLPELVSHLENSFDVRHRIHFRLSIEPILLDISNAVPIGLILNEAITNSIKYAFYQFGHNHNNEIRIVMEKNGANFIQLTIADNGIGISQPIDKTKSLGMKLMEGLTEDLNGHFQISSSNGTTICITFQPILITRP
jgi:two-component sensor histidine kinase